MEARAVIQISFDGACEPVNPGGTASYGWVIRDELQILASDGQIIGSGDGMTNNVAEYTGLIEALKALPRLGTTAGKIKVCGDSQLVCNMVSKKWGWRKGAWLPHKDAPHLKALLEVALELLAPFEYEVQWIPAKENAEADRLSREPLAKADAASLSGQPRCPRCNGKLVLRTGRFGKFYGCSHYPRCKFTQNLKS